MGQSQGTITGDNHRGQSQGTITGDNHRGQSHGTITGDNHMGQSQGTITGDNHRGPSQGTITGDNHRGQSQGTITGDHHTKQLLFNLRLYLSIDVGQPIPVSREHPNSSGIPFADHPTVPHLRGTRRDVATSLVPHSSSDENHISPYRGRHPLPRTSHCHFLYCNKEH